MLECALNLQNDPTPNSPEQVREAVKNSDIIVNARVGDNMNEVMEILEKLFDPGMRLSIQIGYSEEDAESNYKMVRDKLEDLYSS